MRLFYLKECISRTYKILKEYILTDLIFIKHHIKSTIIVYGSARQNRYYKHTVKTMKYVAEHLTDNGEYVVATGGGPGIMEAINKGAHLAGKTNIGLNIKLPMEQHPNIYPTKGLSITFKYFFIRKLQGLVRSKAVLIFPGGIGTLDEFFEVLTLIQTKIVPKMPVILVNKNYWMNVINFDALVEERMIDKDDLNLFSYAENGKQIVKMIKSYKNDMKG